MFIFNILLLLHSLTPLLFQENMIKEELEKKIDKLREQSDINKQEIEQGKAKIEEVISFYRLAREFLLLARYVPNVAKEEL